MDKKTAKKTRLEDIRKFWKKKDEEDRNGQEDKTKKKIDTRTLYSENDVINVKCEFDATRMCVVHLVYS